MGRSWCFWGRALRDPRGNPLGYEVDLLSIRLVTEWDERAGLGWLVIDSDSRGEVPRRRSAASYREFAVRFEVG